MWKQATGRRTTNNIQGGAGGGDDQGDSLRGRGRMETQATARNALHGSITGGRSQGMMGTHATMGTTGGNDGDGGGADCAEREPRRWSDAEDPCGCDGAMTQRSHGDL